MPSGICQALVPADEGAGPRERQAEEWQDEAAERQPAEGSSLWEEVPDWMLTKLMGSMKRRLDDVVAREGGYTGR